MKDATWYEWASLALSLLVILHEIFKLFRDGRLGSPELRLLKSSMETVQNSHTTLLQTIVDKVSRL